MKTWYSAAELAGMAGMAGMLNNKRSVNRIAIRDAWPSRERVGLGGGREYHISVLPQATQVAWAQAQVETLFLAQALQEPGLCLAARAVLERALMARSRQARQATTAPGGKVAGLIAYQQATPGAQQRAEARLRVLEAWWGYRQAHGGTQEAALQTFLRTVHAGGISCPAALRGVSRARLFAWEKTYRQAGIGGLLDHYGPIQRGTRRLPQAQQDYILALITTQPQVTMRVVEQGLLARFGREGLPHYQTIRRFVERWKREHAPLYLYVTNPDAYRSQYKVAFGNASAAIVRLNQRWEMDSTPGDVLLEDGRHSVIGVIDVYSRRLRLLVSRTSTATAVASCLRGALLDWGIPEAVRTDNGQDYVSRHIERILAALEIQQELCEPFTPEQKPFIERALGTFSHHLLTLLPGYAGHNVATREAIRAQQTFAQRLRTPGEAVELPLTAEALQTFCDQWTETVYAHTPHAGTGMDGQTPEARARAWREPVRRLQDERALDVLLAPAAGGNGRRVISKKGLQVAERWYVAPELAASVGEEVLVLLDERDLARVYVFRGNHEFVCIAECPEWTGVSQADVARVARKVQQEVMTEGRKALKQAAREAGVEAVQEEILGYYEARQEKVITLPVPEEPYTTPALEEAARAVDAAESTPLAAAILALPPLPSGVVDARLSFREHTQEPDEAWEINFHGYKRFEYLLKLSMRSAKQEEWMIKYHDTVDEYKNWRRVLPPRTERLLATWEAQRQAREMAKEETHGQTAAYTPPGVSGSANRDAGADQTS